VLQQYASLGINSGQSLDSSNSNTAEQNRTLRRNIHITMKVALSLLAALAAAAPSAASVQGFDISHYQASVDFAGAYDAGARFVMIKVVLS
jgi:GH25 family lysozyme M1 (1,4-beta-N-acetylmuramidase)